MNIIMAKVSAIQAQLEAAAGRTQPPNAAAEETAQAGRPAADTKPKSREGRVHVGAWLPEAYSRNILLVRAKTGLPVKTIFANALNDVFRSHNIPVIDEE
jgi:hypothetical protein